MGLSKYGQSLNKVIDYMSAGKVIIGSYSGFPSMINEAECGEFIPENSIGDLVETITKYCEMAPRVRGRDWITWPSMAYQRAILP